MAIKCLAGFLAISVIGTSGCVDKRYQSISETLIEQKKLFYDKIERDMAEAREEIRIQNRITELLQDPDVVVDLPYFGSVSEMLSYMRHYDNIQGPPYIRSEQVIEEIPSSERLKPNHGGDPGKLVPSNLHLITDYQKTSSS